MEGKQLSSSLFFVCSAPIAFVSKGCLLSVWLLGGRLMEGTRCCKELHVQDSSLGMCNQV